MQKYDFFLTWRKKCVFLMFFSILAPAVRPPGPRIYLRSPSKLEGVAERSSDGGVCVV